MALRGMICPRCGRADSVEAHTRPLNSGDQLDVLFFGWLGFLNSAADRHAWRRCAACGTTFRKPTSAAVFVAGAMALSAAFGVLGGVIVGALEADVAPVLPAWASEAVGFVGENPIAVIGAGLVFSLGLVVALVVAVAGWRRARGRAWAYRCEIDGRDADDGDKG